MANTAIFSVQSFHYSLLLFTSKSYSPLQQAIMLKYMFLLTLNLLNYLNNIHYYASINHLQTNTRQGSGLVCRQKLEQEWILHMNVCHGSVRLTKICSKSQF